MSECYLLCNIVKCRKELKTRGWVTICSHIFCMNHGESAVAKEKCLVCETEFSGKYDIVVTDLNPPEDHKTMVLAGLSPEKIFDIANRSLSFWTYQIYQDRLFRDSQVRAAKQHSAEIADYCESIIAKHKVDVHKLTREIEECRKEIENKMKQTDDLIAQNREKSKLIKNLQSQNDTLKRSLSNYVRSENYSQAEKMETDTKRSCNFYNSPQDFVFEPATKSNFSGNYSYQFK